MTKQALQKQFNKSWTECGHKLSIEVSEYSDEFGDHGYYGLTGRMDGKIMAGCGSMVADRWHFADIESTLGWYARGYTSKQINGFNFAR